MFQTINMLCNFTVLMIFFTGPSYYEIISFTWSEYVNGGDFLSKKHPYNINDIIWYIITIPAIAIQTYIQFRILRINDILQKHKMSLFGLAISFAFMIFMIFALIPSDHMTFNGYSILWIAD